MPAIILSEASPAARSWRDPRTRAIAAGAGLAAYALALIATLPAQFVAPIGSDAAGTVWHGEATIAGATVQWDGAPLESLASASLAARWTLTGPASALTGTLHWRPFAGTTLTAVRGRTDWAQLAAAVPALAADCTVMLDVALAEAGPHGLTGTVTTLPGTCARPGGTPRIVPRLVATFAGGTGRVTAWTDRTIALGTFALTGNVVRLHLTPAGAAVLPGPGRAGDLDFTL